MRIKPRKLATTEAPNGRTFAICCIPMKPGHDACTFCFYKHACRHGAEREDMRELCHSFEAETDENTHVYLDAHYDSDATVNYDPQHYSNYYSLKEPPVAPRSARRDA